jgi:hypothetical protein
MRNSAGRSAWLQPRSCGERSQREGDADCDLFDRANTEFCRDKLADEANFLTFPDGF